MKKEKLEFTVGVFIIMGFLSLAYLSINLTKFKMKAQGGYILKAYFENVGGLKKGANVEIAGVPIGMIKKIKLEDYKALVFMQIKNGVKIPDDSMAVIKTKGLLGEKYMEIMPGASETYYKDGDEIIDTQAPLDFEKAIGKFIFGKVK